MSDERRRELERTWRTSGDPLDGAALLRERVRLGELEARRIALAAYLGDPAARAAAPDAPVADPAAPLAGWLAAAPSGGPQTWPRAGLVVLRAARARAAADAEVEPLLERAERVMSEALAAGRVGTPVVRSRAADAKDQLAQLLVDRLLAQIGAFSGGGDAPSAAPIEVACAALDLLANPGRVETLRELFEPGLTLASPHVLRAAMEADLLRWCLD